MADPSHRSITVSIWIDRDLETMCEVCWRTGYVTVTWAHITPNSIRSEKKKFCALCRREQSASTRHED